MFKLIGTLIKSVLLVIIVLAAGSLVEIKGRSLSDHVSTTLEEFAIDEWVYSVAGKVSRFTNEQASAIRGDKEKGRSSGRKEAASKSAKRREDIPQSERQKLRALIHELNGSVVSATR